MPVCYVNETIQTKNDDNDSGDSTFGLFQNTF